MAALLLHSTNPIEAKDLHHRSTTVKHKKNAGAGATNNSLLEPAPRPPQKIVGGDQVIDGPDRYPWFTRMMFYNSWGGCGGMLVAPEYVLTAAHCVGGFNGVQVGALCPEDPTNCGQVSD